MATINETGWTSWPAAADFSAIKWPRLVVRNSSGEAALCGAGARPDGIADGIARIKQGEQVRVSTFDGREMKCEVGAGGVAANAKVCSDAAGRLVAGATGHRYVGTVYGAAAQGEVVKFLVDRNLGTVA